MCDTLKLWIEWDKISRANPLDVLDRLSYVTKHQNTNGVWHSGNCGDFKVSISPFKGISLHGSLPKYYFGNNIQTLTRNEIRLAFEKLNNELGIDVGVAEIRRLDISTVLDMLRTPSDYYDCLGDKKHFERVQVTADSLYYNNYKQQIIFYNKAKEAKDKGVEIPSQFVGKNLLRYELRYTKRLRKQLQSVTASTLYDELFFSKMVQSWYDEFMSISKIPRITMNCDNINTPKDAKDAILATLLQEKGQEYVDRVLADLKASNLSSKYRTMIKTDLRELMTSTSGQRCDLLVELNTKMLETKNKMLFGEVL
jgi:hypothetical protein